MDKAIQHQAIHVDFLAILPRIVVHARIYFRDIKDAGHREEAIAEVVAVAWKSYLRLVKRGKDVIQFASRFARFTARAVRSGRRVCGQLPGKDVLSPLAQRRHCFAVHRLPDNDTLNSNPLSDALMDNTVTPPDDQAAFRVDFTGWLGTRTERDRRVVYDLMMSETTADVARKFGLSHSRVSQLRRDFCQDWNRYCGEDFGLQEAGEATSADIS